MTDTAEKLTYPTMSRRHWWDMRDCFKQAVPRVVDAIYVSSSMGSMTAASARRNIIGPMRNLGLIDKDGVVTDLGKRWRLDDEYASVCEEIRNSVYPSSLLDAQPPPDPDPERSTNWFMQVAGVGAQSATRMADMYVLLCHADVIERGEAKPVRRASTKKASETPKRSPQKVKTTVTPESVQAHVEHEKTATTTGSGLHRRPSSLHIDIQIHISPESTDKQIDAIFASMAKHLYLDRSDNGD